MKWSDGRYSRWERAKNWIVHILLQEELDDMVKDSYAEGVGSGYVQGHLRATEGYKRSEIDLYEQGKVDGIRSEQSRLCTFPASNVIKQSQDGRVYLGGHLIADSEVTSLKAEAKALTQMRLWDVFHSTVGETARQTMFEKSQDFNDMLTGKLMLYNLEKLNAIVKTIDGLKVKK